MLKIISKYFVSFLLFSILGIISIDSLLLPFLTKKGNEIYLPDVRSLDITEAEKILDKFNLKIHYVKYNEIYKEGEVINTSPRAFTKVKLGRDIKISIASAKKDFIMENFIDKSYRSTKLLLDRNDIIIDTTIYEYNDKTIKDNIIYHYPKSVKKIMDNTLLTFIIIKVTRPDYYRVPDLINLGLSSALKKIAESGLLVGKIEYEYDSNWLNNTVLEQNPTENQIVTTPREINLIISKDTTDNE